MNHPANPSPWDLEQLLARIAELERRVCILERRQLASPVELGGSAASATQPEKSQQELKISIQSAGLVGITGRAVMGIAGAYLLRAAAESQAVSKLLIVAALVYAWAWQYLSVRTGKSSRLAGGVYGITFALILFPMLWELTGRFQILPAFVTAGLLAACVGSAFVLARSPDSAVTLWVTTIFASGSAFGLFVATRDPLPFLVALLSIVAIAEVATCRKNWHGAQIVPEILLDLTLVAFLYLATLPGGFPAAYTAVTIPLCLVLFGAAVLISAGSAAYRTIRQQARIRVVEIVQSLVTFCLLLLAVIELGGSAEKRGFGLICFLLSAICYLIAFFRKDTQTHPRNALTYSVWAGSLFLVGSYLLLPGFAVTPWLAVCSLLATLFGIRIERLALAFHGFAWLLAAEISSSVLSYAGHFFAGTYPTVAPAFTWLCAGSAAVGALVFLRNTLETTNARVLRSGHMVNSAYLLGGLAVFGIVTALHGHEGISIPQLALIRSVVICVVTVSVAAIGTRWKHRELFWICYAVIGLGVLKLIAEDLRSGSKASFAFSLVAFGILLAVIPRLFRNTLEQNGTTNS